MSELDNFIGGMGRLGNVADLAAKIAAPKLDALVKAQVAAGVDPSGKPWRLKKDGDRALVNAARAVRAEADGEYIYLVVEGPEYWHQVAKADGSLPQRKMIPEDGDELSEEMMKILDESVDEALARLLGAA